MSTVIEGETIGLSDVSFTVPGVPAPQGSKDFKGFRGNGTAILKESSKAVGPWRERVALAAAGARGGSNMFAQGEPLEVRIIFTMPRPASAPKTRTPAAVKRPDLDKLARAVLDALTNVLFPDDSAVVSLAVVKRIADPDRGPFADISVHSLAEVFPTAVHA